MSSEELSNQIKQTRNELGGLQSEVRRTDAELKAYGKSTETLENKQEALQKVIAKQEDQMESLSIAYERSVKATGSASKESIFLQKQMNNLGASLAKNKGELSQVQSELTQLGGSATKAGSDLNSFEAQMKNADASIESYKSEVKKAGAELKLFGANSDTVGNKIEALKNLYSSQEQKMESLNRAYQEQVNHSGKASNAALELKTKMNNLAVEMTNVQSEIKQTADSMNELDNAGSSGGEAGPFTGLVNGAKALVAMEVADKIAEVGDKIKEIGAVALESFGQVQDSQQKMQNAFGLTSEEAKVLTDTARGLARDGFVPSMEEASEAIRLVKTNLKGLDNQGLRGVTEQAIALEKTFGMDMDETLRGVNGLMVNFGLTAEEAMDLMTVGAQNGLDKTHELGDNMAEYSQLWAQMGYSAQDTFAMLQSGLDAGAYNLDKVNDLVKEMGVSLTDGRFEKNIDMFSKSTQDLFKKWQEGGASQKDVINSMIQDFGKMDGQYEQLNKAGTIWSSLGEDNSMKVIQALGKTSEAYDNVGGAAKKMADNSVTDVDKLKGAMEDLKIALAPIGEAIAKAITPFIKGLKSLGDSFSNLSPGMQDIIVKIGIFLAAFATILPVITAVVAGIGLLGTAATALGIGLGSLVGIIAGVAAAIAAIIVVIMNWGSITEWIGEKWSSFIDWLSGVWDGMKGIASSAWESVVETISGVWSSFTGKMSGIFEGIASWFSGVWEGFKEIAAKAWEAIGDVIVGVLNLWFQWITLPIRVIITAIILIWEGLKAVASAIWSAIGDTIVGIWNGLVGFAQTIWNTISSVITDVWNGILVIANFIWNSLVTIVTTTWNIISTAASTIWNAISGVISSVWDSIVNVVTTAGNFVMNIVTGAWNTIVSITTSIWNVVKNVLTSAWGSIKSVVSTGINLVQSVITAGWNVIKSVTSSVWDGIKAVISSVLNAIKAIVSPAVNAVQSIISSVWNSIRSVTSSVWNGISSVISRTVGTINSVIGGIKGVISGVSGAFHGLLSTVSSVMNRIVGTIQSAWNKAGKLLSKLNPFGAEGEMVIREEDPNPYHPEEGPMPATGSFFPALRGIATSVGNATNSIRNGINTTMSNMNTLRMKESRVSNALAGNTTVLASSSDLMKYVRQAVAEQNQESLPVFSQMIELLAIIAQKDNNIYVDGDNLTNVLSKRINDLKNKKANQQGYRSVVF